MTPSLLSWIRDADAARLLEQFRVPPQNEDRLEHLKTRADDYYLALVGALFDQMRTGSAETERTDWARLGNALAQFAADERSEMLDLIGVPRAEPLLYAAAAFYCGGYPASASLTMRGKVPVTELESTDDYLACSDLLNRRKATRSQTVSRLLNALRKGDLAAVDEVVALAKERQLQALRAGPNEWIPARLLEKLIERFQQTNIRAVLPEGESDSWTPLIASFLERSPPTWEFFPSQVEAIRRGLIDSTDTYSLQMPTGAGKTALCETLLFRHATSRTGEVALLLVPYRSLASELRWTLVRRLSDMGISSRCAYGGTVPTGDESRDLGGTRVIVATPEALSGLLSADASFFRRISLVICDEGHLLDGGRRGVSLELLLARLRSRGGGGPRFVFVSAIVPNIEEINTWLGGPPTSVVRSDYRPALAEFAVLKASGGHASDPVHLVMHPHEPAPPQLTVGQFLCKQDFQLTNVQAGRRKNYRFNSYKTRAVAAARKALPMGGVVVFAANKRGKQGAVGLAEELLKQLELGLPLPVPLKFAQARKIDAAVEYLRKEYGPKWIGTAALAKGAVLHHGDIPQETREVIELLLRQEFCRLAICTSTLAEGVNLPIRTLVLYSVSRRRRAGGAETLLTRDIKNLVGRAGRAGANTKGLVICANEKQWPAVQQVARQATGEPVTGALRGLVHWLGASLARKNQQLSDGILEQSPELHTLVDGIDATLIDLATEEVGVDALVQIATGLADQTFASQQSDPASRVLLQEVFSLRARKVAAFGATPRLGWVRETGARMRLVESVEQALAPSTTAWKTFDDPLDSNLLKILLDWAWNQPDFAEAVRETTQADEHEDLTPFKERFMALVAKWLAGASFAEIGEHSQMKIDDVLAVHTRLVSFVFQTLVEQGIALLARYLANEQQELSLAVQAFPDHLRFGVPTSAALALSARLRHRRAAVELGAVAKDYDDNWRSVFVAARRVLEAEEDWRQRLGELVFENTLADLERLLGAIGNK